MCFPKDSFYYHKLTPTIFQRRLELQKCGPRAPLFVKRILCFNIMRSKEQYGKKKNFSKTEDVLKFRNIIVSGVGL